VGDARILAVLEPRSNTMKLGTMKEALPGSLARPTWCSASAPAGDALGWDLAEALAPLGEKAAAFDDLDALVQAVKAAAQPGDHAGDEQRRLRRRTPEAAGRAGMILYLHGFRSSPQSFKAR
jgi:UDP-N-acetylmuramate-alanine ligase